jgi:hypothetical protein
MRSNVGHRTACVPGTRAGLRLALMVNAGPLLVAPPQPESIFADLNESYELRTVKLTLISCVLFCAKVMNERIVLMVSSFEFYSLVFAALAAALWLWPSLVIRDSFNRAAKKVSRLNAGAAVFALLAVLFEAIVLLCAAGWIGRPRPALHSAEAILSEVNFK